MIKQVDFTWREQKEKLSFVVPNDLLSTESIAGIPELNGVREVSTNFQLDEKRL
jgi:hypothetical protein